MSTMRRQHPWMLTAPWYRWSTVGVPEAGRGSKPEIQQYAGFDYAREFLREPQRSLKPQDRDYFHRTLIDESKLPKPGEPLPLGVYLREKTQIRKLYQPLHGYSYLVVTELHCDVAGFPSVDPAEVEEAGFVVRRLEAIVDAVHRPLAEAELQKIAVIREQLEQLNRAPSGRIRGEGLLMRRWLDRPVEKKRAELLEEHAQHKLALDELAAARAFELRTEAWIVDANDPSRGRWVELSDPTPEHELAGEAVVAMNLLFPDPNDTRHSARGRTLFSGTTPTGGREVDGTTLAPRFDDRHLYEIRCFVRRKPHKPGCPGELVWGAPSIGYRIAPDTDFEGGTRLPISISVPSFSDVRALADRMATGAAGGVRIVMPPDSVLPISGDLDDLKGGTPNGIGQICFIAILLLFIIALMLMIVFLPIIVFLFQLFFLLRLKFCIPPAIDLELEIAIDLKLELELEFELSIEAKAEFALELEAKGLIPAIGDPTDPAQTNAAFEAWVDAELTKVYDGKLLEALLKADISVRVQRLLDLRADFRGSVEPELIDALNLEGWPLTNPSPAPTPDNGPGSLTPSLPFVSDLIYYDLEELPA